MTSKQLPSTIAAAQRFEEITGVKPIGARANPGSMREFTTIKVLLTQEVWEFCQSFYDVSKGDARHNFRGVTVKFISYYSYEEGSRKQSYASLFISRSILSVSTPSPSV